MEHIIEVRGLKKSYGKIDAVRGIDFYVEKGSLFAFLGPNGAGKSTTIDMICTLLQPDAGTALIDGKELGKQDSDIRKVIGAVFQDGVLDNLLTVQENLMIRGGFYGLSGSDLKRAVKDAAENAGVTELLKRPYGKLSGGQRRRADIARSLIHHPKILFLDEPTTGLDPQTRKSVWETIQALQKQTGMTIFLTTHYMEEATEADYVIVIDNGKIAAQGTPTYLKQTYASDMLKLSAKDMAALGKMLSDLGIDNKRISGQYIVKIKETMDALPLIDKLKGHIDGFEVVNGTMDDAFIGITGRELRE